MHVKLLLVLVAITLLVACRQPDASPDTSPTEATSPATQPGPAPVVTSTSPPIAPSPSPTLPSPLPERPRPTTERPPKTAPSPIAPIAPTDTPTPFPTATSTPTRTPKPEPDRPALVAFYNATDGPNWALNRRWLTDAPVGDWWGIEATPDGIVVSIGLGNNQLSGQLPAELGNLSGLMVLNLKENDLTGEIPPELGNLSNLTRLWLDHNQFTGTVPPELGNLSNLFDLRIGHYSGLTGCVPASLEDQLTRHSNLGDLPFCE